MTSKEATVTIKISDFKPLRKLLESMVQVLADIRQAHPELGDELRERMGKATDDYNKWVEADQNIDVEHEDYEHPKPPYAD